MPTPPSIHDNHVYAYTVDCQERRLTLHTVFRDRTPNEYTDVLFTGVVAHQFEHVLAGNILFSIEPTELTPFVECNEALFAESWRYCWPPVEYGGNLQALVNALRDASAQAFVVNSSYGLSGWVLAVGMDLVVRNSPKRIA